MKSRIALIVAVAALGSGCDAFPDLMRDAVASALKTEVENAVGDAVQGVTSTVFDDILGGLVPETPIVDPVASASE